MNTVSPACLVFAFLFALCVPTKARTNEFFFEDIQAGFSLRLAGGWVELPAEEFHRAAGFGAKLEPTPPPREIRAVFQRGTNVGPNSFPRIVVHAQNAAPVGERQFRALHSAPLVEITVAQSLGFSGRPTWMKTARYDAAGQYLAFNFDCYMEDFGFMRALGRSFLTADGLVNIYGYAPAADFSSFEPEFGNIVSSFRISPEHRFQPERDAKQPLVEKTTSWKQLGWVVGLMALAGIGWIVLSRWRNSVYSDEL